jgi:hypothetical protein
MRIANIDLIPDGAEAMATSFNLEPTWLGHICNFSIQLVFTGSPVGTFSLQCSDDPGVGPSVNLPPSSEGVIHWTDIADSAQAISAAGNHSYNFQNAGFTWVRLVWTAISGSGSLTSARINIKGV